MKTLKNLPKKDRNIVVRVDWNIPTSGQDIIDASRIKETLPTLRHLSDNGHHVTLISHRGRPKSKEDLHLSFLPLLKQLEHHCATPIHVIDSISELGMQWDQAPLSLFDNIRFYPEELTNDVTFAHQLATAADAYVNDALSVSHRAHASVDAITQHLPCYAGRLLEKEISMLDQFITTPKHPLMAICGGAKVSTKVPFIEHMLKHADIIALVGGIANTFWAAKGMNVGKSLVDQASLPIAQRILRAAEQSKCGLWLPNYVRVASQLDELPTIKHITELNDNDCIFDIAARSYECLLKTASITKMTIWNGALGVFEHDAWNEGTFATAKGLAQLTENNTLLSLAGGGETVMALNTTHTFDKLTYVSMAGGGHLWNIFLENCFLESKP